jgi:hypothetical protein
MILTHPGIIAIFNNVVVTKVICPAHSYDLLEPQNNDLPERLFPDHAAAYNKTPRTFSGAFCMMPI